MKRMPSVLILFAWMFSIMAWAGDARPFEKATFDRLRAAGAPVLVQVHADWCSTCKRQAQVVSEALRQPEFAPVTVLTVNYDRQRDALKELKVTTQSTLIMFKGDKEVARSVADTEKARIEAMLRRAL